MFAINRDNLGRFAKSRKLWKAIGITIVGLLIWFWVHMFFSIYTIQHQRGVYGIVSKATYQEQLNDHAKATVWDATPSTFIEPSN